jgi:NADPH:quinone reductase-like Zn-dependent oxidoreductase
MRAITIHRHGGPEEIMLDEVPRPVPGRGEVVVKLASAALNHLDIWVRSGIHGLRLDFPHVMGSDGSGTIDEIGEGVEGAFAGQGVLIDPGISCGRCEFCTKGEHSECLSFHLLGEHINGTFAEYVKVPAENIHPIPEHLSFDEAAALPLVFLTAWRMLITRGKMKAGEDLLIIGIGGGVAGAALLIGLALGARVIVTSGDSKKLERAVGLGAARGIDHNRQDISKEVRRLTDNRGVDLCFDSVGQATWTESLKCLARGGRMVTCGATSGPVVETDIRRIFWNQLTIIGSTMGNRNDMREMLRFVERTSLRPIIDSVTPMKDARAAHEKMLRGVQFGKLVLKISEQDLQLSNR